MSQLEIANTSSSYVPSLQRTEGQPPPIAANGGLSYMSFDRDGDAGTAKAIEDALAEIASGEGQRVIDMIDKAPPGPIKTRWGLAFRDYDECVTYIRELEQHQGSRRRRGAAAALHGPRAADLFHRSVQCHLARPGTRRRRGEAAQERAGQPAAQPLSSRRCCATRGASASTTRASRPTARNAWTGSASRWRTSSPSARTSTTRPRWSACSTRRSRSCCSSSSPARPTRWSTTTTSSTRTMRATARRTRTPRTPA